MLLQLVEPGQTPLPHEKGKTTAIGIDLGTTHSLVAIFQQGSPKILRDEKGVSLLPSTVFYDREKTLVGKMAQKKGAQQPERMISSFKRFMGKSEQGEQTHHFNVGDRHVTPVEMSAEILRSLKMRAEKYLGDNVTQAVITVPAYFDDAARTATRDAARLAGLEVLRLVNEPTAAALAYGLEHGVQGIYAIYDLGGGTFDLSLLNLEGEVFKVLSTGGDTQLGGDDMDRLLLTTLLSSQTELLAEDSLALVQARRIKEYLTDHETWSGSIQVKNNLLEDHITRLDFERLISPLIDKTLKICRQVVRDAQISLNQIKGVVLVGGATRIPLVRQKVERFFGQVPLTNINPDEVVALGAALQAEALTEGSQRLLLDVAPLSLGLETYGGVVEKIILRNSPIPASHWQNFTTFQDNQTGMSLHIVQGERELVQDCRSLAHFELRGIPLMKAGMARIRVTFTIDADGILTVSAREQTTGIHQSIDVKPSYGLTEEDLLRMIEESHSHARSDMAERFLREARVEAERLFHAVKEALKNDGDLLEESEKIEVKQEAEALISVLNSVKRDDIERKTERLRQVTNSWAERRMNQAMRKALKGKKL